MKSGGKIDWLQVLFVVILVWLAGCIILWAMLVASTVGGRT